MLPCAGHRLAVWQRNAGILNLSRHTFQHRVKIQELSVSFNLAESQRKMSLEHCDNKDIHGTRNIYASWHYQWFYLKDAGCTEDGFIKGCQEGTKNTSHWH